MTPHAHRWWPAAITAGALVAGGGLWLRACRGAPTAPRDRYETAVIDRGPIRAKVTATGTVNPTVQVQVGSQVSGTIQSLGADFNSAVTPGQMIAQIDPRLFRAAVAQARANLLAARAATHKMQAQLADARRTAARNRDLLTQHLIAQAVVDASDTARDVAVAALEQAVAAEAQARAALDTAELNLTYTTIRSPIRGTVITRNIDVGQTVAASFAAPTLFLIGEDLTKMEVDTNIAEADVGALAPGLAATFTVDAYPSEIFRGTIRQVRSSPQIIQNVVTYNAVIDVGNPALELRPGMTANLEIVYAERGDVVRVANAALRFQPPAALALTAGAPPPLGKKRVWVLRGDVPVPVVIEPGVRDGSYTEVRSGLTAGERVITEAIAPRAPARML
ncbi:MAG TPA: efflux RND transporter periplasmic adaptor subunit [Kofleriaceae bacterium]|nr:efflux RND transporter periplasmic adaptor subunit [Kofleriaceae bacterium]